MAVLFAGIALPATSAAPATTTPRSYAVGMTTETFVDTTRSTPAWGPNPTEPSRTLVTTILYPAQGAGSRAPTPGAPPDRTGAPYPLIVFAHGLGGDPQQYLTLLRGWAAAGFVVAAPRFPLSSDQTPGGPDGGDVVNQPGDVSFVVTSLLHLAAPGPDPLSGLVNPDEIGAAGHSNGGITTLGLVANTCCHDPRISAAVVMAGATEGYPGGHYDFSLAPPLLLVHDTDDELVPYAGAVSEFDEDQQPKGLLTIEGVPAGDAGDIGAGHMASAAALGPAAPTVIRVTTDFFRAYLDHDHAALEAIAADGRSAHTRVAVDWSAPARATLPVPAPPVAHLHATASPSTGLVNGEPVTVHWSGYTPGKVVNILECSHVRAGDRQLQWLRLREWRHPAPRSLRLGVGHSPRGRRHGGERSVRLGALLRLHREQLQLHAAVAVEGAGDLVPSVASGRTPPRRCRCRSSPAAFPGCMPILVRGARPWTH